MGCSPGTTETGTAASSLATYLEDRAREAGFSGVVLVARGDEVLLRQAYGLADRELGVPLETGHILPIGSLTKPITAVAALRLVQRGILDTGNRLCAFLAKCPDEWTDVTIEHLLTHTSGIPDLFEDVECAPVEETAAEIETTLAAADPTLDFTPGDSYDYNNFGYVLLAYVMELATGELWEDILRREVLAPLEMEHTRYDDVWAIVPGRARGYELVDDQIANIQYDDHCAYAAGGLHSTVDDLAAFLRGAHTGLLLSAESRSAAFRPIGGGFYGYGWAVERSFGRPVHDHTGGIGGFSSYIAYYPEDELSVVVLSNLQEENTSGTACDLAAMYFAADWVPTGDFTASPPRVEELLDFVGVFENDEVSIEISRDAGSLSYERNGGRARRLVPVAPDLFARQGAEQLRLRFDRDREGGVEQLTILRCGEVDTVVERR